MPLGMMSKWRLRPKAAVRSSRCERRLRPHDRRPGTIPDVHPPVSIAFKPCSMMSRSIQPFDNNRSLRRPAPRPPSSRPRAPCRLRSQDWPRARIADCLRSVMQQPQEYRARVLPSRCGLQVISCSLTVSAKLLKNFAASFLAVPWISRLPNCASLPPISTFAI